MDYENILLKLKENEISFSERPSNLLCLSPSDEYLNADVKVMIFGQENNDWEGDFCHSGGVKHLLSVYEDFYNSGQCYKYGGQFWNGISKLKSELKSTYEERNKSVGLIWNNVVKIGKSGKKGLPPKDVLDWSKPTIDLIRDEIEFYKPDVVVFFSGPYYDRFLKQAFPDVTFETFSKKSQRQLSRLKSNYLPSKSIRTYHPNYLWRIGFYEYLELIINELRS